MSKKLESVFKDLLKMPYFENERARSGKTINGHEDAIAVRFEDHSFKRLNNNDYPKLGKTIKDKWIENDLAFDWLKDKSDTNFKSKPNQTFDSMPLGSFLEQPGGSQSFPDFLVRDFDGRFLAVEAKSGRDGRCPMWNDNVPKQNAVYILSSGLLNETTVFLGKDVITEDAYTLMEQQEKEIAKIVKKYNDLMEEADNHNRGWIQKSRKQHFQGGGMEKTNYFDHEDRKQCENNVLEFVR